MRIQKGYRSNRGQQLIELLFAVAISGFLAVMMGASLAQTLAASGNVENQLKAYEIGEELVDRIRRSPYSNLIAGTYSVPVYSDDGVPNGSLAFQTLPLILDDSAYTWDPASLANRLKGPSPNGFATVSVVIAPTPLATDAMTSTITVSWAENSVALRTMTFTSVVSRDGIHE